MNLPNPLPKHGEDEGAEVGAAEDEVDAGEDEVDAGEDEVDAGEDEVDAVEAEDNEGEAGGAGWREDEEEEEEAAADHLQLTMKGSRIFNRGGELICRPDYNHLKQTKEMPCSN
uniref:Uncharacterized protein n=1 Tax=Knipowitschia caucasica TaxID=637954 RepID=A0AAV2J3K2_KNICA